jgi:queuine tRNA-ribosyltransferase
MVAGEILGCTLLTIHNLAFYLDLVAQARAHIEAGDYGAWHRAWVARYESGAEAR